MRFAFAHKLSTYLMVWSAFLALGLSGELSPIALLLCTLGIFASWWWEPPRISYDKFRKWWTALTLAMFLFSLISILTTGEFLLTAAHFLLYLLAAKLFNRRACKDYQHIYILTFLMLVAGTVLNAEFTYGLFFLGYVVSATWALTLFHLRREMEDNFLLKHKRSSSQQVQIGRILNSRRIVGKRFFIGTSAVSLSIFLSATLLFLVIPRIGFGLFFQKSRGGVHMAGFSDGVQLGGHGVIKTNKTVVMRVHVDDEYAGRKAPYIHWRGVAFDYYKDGEWMRSRRAPATNRTVVPIGGGRGKRHHLTYDRPNRTSRQLNAALASKMKQEIYLEPMGYDVLFGASMPAAFEIEQRFRETTTKRSNDELRHPHTAGIKYVVYSDPERVDDATLRAATGSIPDGYEAYLQLPDEITPEVYDLTEQILSAAGAETTFDKAAAIERWLKTNLGYTLEMKSPGDAEPIHHFLFSRKKGHCEYFSSAMAVMLRVADVPSRNVNGFLGGEWNEYDNYIAVRAGDAHSWVEAYVPGYGWVTFDPTPAAADVMGRGDTSILDKLRRMIDTLRFKWFKWVIEYDLTRQVSLFRSAGKSVKKGAQNLIKGKLRAAKEWAKRHKWALGGGAAGIALLLALIGWLRQRAPGRAMSSDRRRRAVARGPIGRAYRRAIARYAKLGHTQSRFVTPREFATRLDQKRVAGAKAMCELTELYYAARYGDDDSDTGAAAGAIAGRAGELADSIESALVSARKQAKAS